MDLATCQNLVNSVDAQKVDVLSELDYIANQYPSNTDIAALISARNTVLYGRLSTLDSNRATHINNFINASPALSVPSAYQAVIAGLAPKYIDSLKNKTPTQLDVLWGHLANSSDSIQSMCICWSFCNL